MLRFIVAQTAALTSFYMPPRANEPSTTGTSNAHLTMSDETDRRSWISTAPSPDCTYIDEDPSILRHNFTDFNIVLAIDKQIQQLESTIRTLKSQRNRHLRVNTLPPELLIHVFELTRDEPPSSNWEIVTKWINFSHVCTAWRTITLGTPKLWSTLTGPLASGPWLKTMLTRAKHVPVQVDISLRSDTAMGQISEISEHLDHMEVLRLSGRHELLNHAFSRLLRPAPILEELSIESTFRGTFRVNYHADIPAPIFNGVMPQLRRIALRGHITGWHHLQSRFDRITNFTGNHQENSSMRGPDTRMTWINSLNRMQALQQLELSEKLSLLFTSNGPDLTFPALTSLALNDGLEPLAHFIHKIRIPSISCIKISASTMQTAPNAVIESIHTLKDFFLPYYLHR
jgi:ribosome-associated translation inhibitor RaiA